MGWFSKVGSFIKENAHTILDVAGMIPGVGAVADIANAALYAAEGDWANAAMSAVSAIPGIGDTVAMANKGVKAAKGVKTALKAGKSLKSLLKAGGKSIVKAIKGKAKAGAKALKNWKETLGSIFKKKKTGDKHVCTGDKCFTGDTLVYTEKGHIPIREIREGDKVYSRNEQTGEMGFKKIEQIFRTETHTIHSIEVNGNTVIRTTAYHRFYVEEKGWVNAINLQIGDCLITPEGQACITAVGKERFEEPVIMYNFHVEEWASYFVSELGLYVHNGIGDHDGIGNSQVFENKGYNPKPGERTFDGYVKQNVPIDKEINLHTNSKGFNNNNKGVGGDFKRFGSDSHGGLAPHVHQPTRNVNKKTGEIYGGTFNTSTKTGGVTSPNAKDVKQLYQHLNNGKY